MSGKCPKCGFEPIDGLAVCPNCGFNLEDEAAKHETEPENAEKNDDIQWSDYTDLPLESVMEMLNDDLGEPEVSEADVPEANITEDVSSPAEDSGVSEEEQPTASTEEALSTESADEEVPADDKEEPTASEEAEDEHPEILAHYINSHKHEGDVSEAAAEDEEAQQLSESEAIAAEPEPAAEAEASIEEVLEPTVSEEKPKEESDVIEKETAYGVPTTFYEDEKKSSEGEAAKTVQGTASSENQEPPKKSRKLLYTAAAAVVLLGAGGWVVYNQQQKAAEEQRLEEQKQKDALADIQEQIDAFYLDEEQLFIKADKASEDITELDQELSNYTKTSGYDDVETAYTNLANKMSQLSEVNSYFTEPIVVGDTLNDKPLLKADKAITLKKLSGDDDFSTLLDEAREIATTQYDTLQGAKTAAEKVYKDNKVVENATREDYEAAVAAVKKVDNQELVKTLVSNLEKVDTELTKQEEAAEQEAEAAAQAAASAAGTTGGTDYSDGSSSAAGYTSSGSTSTTGYPKYSNDNRTVEIAPGVVVDKNTGNQAVIAEIQSQINDTANAGWSWNAGIMEKVIATCKERGYIVDGGYYLQPAQIINGEGYYNLYATNNKSSLLKGIDDAAFPLYLISINCKTGYFIGNGSDQTQ